MVFGEQVEGYPVRVFNEREVRAAAGILFLFASFSFANAWFKGNYLPLKIFVTSFLIDFIIRLFIDSKFSPSMVLGRLSVQNQEVEYSGAPQKRFAWFLGLGLATFMFLWLVVFNFVGLVNLFVCLACLIFLFSESALGICWGCKIYGLINKKAVQLCPGNVCSIKKREPIQKTTWEQVLVVFVLMGLLFALFSSGVIANEPPRTVSATQDVALDDCEVPQWAIDMGHEDQYLIHHGCV